MRRLMLISTAMFVIGVGNVGTAQAHTRLHHAQRHHHYSSRSHGSYSHGIYKCADCVVRDTLAGIVSVSARNANRFVGVINDLWNAGFRGPVHCAASGGHVRHSRHYSGNACDFAQTGWGKTKPIMYHREAAAIIAKYGLTNGCSFHDCGHVGTDGGGSGRHYASRKVHYARHRHVHYASR